MSTKPTWNDTMPIEDAPTWDSTTEIEEPGLARQAAGAVWDSAVATGEFVTTAGGQIGRNIPVAGPLAVKAGNALRAGLVRATPGLEEGKDFEQLYDQYTAEDAANQARIADKQPIAAGVGAALGAAALPVPFGKTAGLGGAAARVGSNAALEGADQLVRGKDVEDAAQGAGLAGGLTAAVESLPVVGKAAGAAGRWAGKKAGNVVFGVPEQATERYLANPAAVKGAGDLKSISDEFVEEVDNVRKGLSRDSGEAYRILSDAPPIDQDVILQPIRDAQKRLVDLGNFGPDSKQAVKFYDELGADVAELAAQTDFKLGADKGKRVIAALDGKIDTMQRSGGDTQVLRSLTDTRKAIDEQLKATVPGYREHMAELAESTKAARGIADSFRSDAGAYNTLKGIMRGNSPYKADDLAKFDQRFGTTFGESLKDSYAKQAFQRDTTNGSRKTMAGAAAGSAVGSLVAGPFGAPVGGALGAGAGATVDKYGGLIYQRILDGSLAVGKYAEPLKRIYEQRGPAALAAAHAALRAQDPEYATATDSIAKP